MTKYKCTTSAYEFIFKLNTDIWDIPQYVVFYYKDRVDIYRCKPETEENIYNTLFLNILKILTLKYNLFLTFLQNIMSRSEEIFNITV